LGIARRLARLACRGHWADAKTEAEIYALVIAAIKAGIAIFSPAVQAQVLQAYQPRVVGAPTGPAILLSNAVTKRYGFLHRHSYWAFADTPPVMVHVERQAMQTRLQVNALVPATPPTSDGVAATLPVYSANDLLQFAAAALQSDAGVTQLRNGGLGVERITDSRQPYFKDDMDQFEASPSFDVTFDWSWTIKTTTPIIVEETLKIYAV
jgi:hypothetical protein